MTVLYHPKVVFERALLRVFRKNVKPFLKYLPKDCFKGAFTWELKWGQHIKHTWEVRLPEVGFYYTTTKVFSAAGAKREAFEAYVRKCLTEDQYKEYEAYGAELDIEKILK